MITGREAYVNYFRGESQPVANDPNHIKPKRILSTLNDNALFAWFYLLEDTLPILNRMNVLFQATLPLPHLLFERVETAKDEMRFMVGQEPRDDLFSESLVSADTPFGPALESFLEGCNTRKHKYGNNGGIIKQSQRAALKKNVCPLYVGAAKGKVSRGRHASV